MAGSCVSKAEVQEVFRSLSKLHKVQKKYHESVLKASKVFIRTPVSDILLYITSVLGQHLTAVAA